MPHLATLSILKLDTGGDRGHTQDEMNRVAQALELRPAPLVAQSLVLGLVILTVIVILPL
jgi:hypothetical protein